MVVRHIQIWMILLAFVSFWILGSVGIDEINRMQIRKWPTLQARIVESRYECTTAAKGQTCWPIIRYAYAVKRQPFEGNVVQIGPKAGSEYEMIRIVSQYPKAKAVEIYYNPTHPSDSVLEPFSRSSNYYSKLIVGLFLLFLAIMIRIVFL